MNPCWTCGLHNEGGQHNCIEALKAELAHYKWRPIADIHEDSGPCVLMNLADPGYLEIGSNLNADFDESLWTHFAEVPKLSTKEAVALAQAMGQHREVGA